MPFSTLTHLLVFIDKLSVCSHSITIVRISQPISVEAISGWDLSSGLITKATIPLVLQVAAHHEVLTFYLIATPRHPIFLGLSWLETHNPTVDWYSRSITFPISPIPARSWHSLDSVADESSLVTTLAVVLGDITITVNNLPAQYSDFSDIFENWNADRLLTHRPYDHICPIISQRASFNPPNHWLAHQSYLSKRRTAPYTYLWIIGVSTKLRYVIIIPCL